MSKATVAASALLLGTATAAMAIDNDTRIDIDVNAKVEARLDQLDAIADESIERLSSLSQSHKELYDRAHGYAVFDSTKAGLLVTGSGGTGVAVDRSSGERIYMRMAGAGVALGGGAQQYKLILLFDTESDFEQFTNGDWNGNASAQAVIGEKGANSGVDFEDGVAAFQIGQKGLMAQADISGLKFWVADGLETNNS